MAAETAQFTRDLPVRKEFRTVLDDASYQPAPDDWLIAVSDVVGSRKAIASGQYKAVNVAGVAIISALMNALETQDLPFIFGGDGAAVICAPSDRARGCRNHGQDRRMGEGRSRTGVAGSPGTGFGGAGPGVRRARAGDAGFRCGQQLRVSRRRHFPRRRADEGRRIRRAPGAARQQARPDRIVMPLVADKAGGREHRLDHHRSRGERRRAVSEKAEKLLDLAGMRTLRSGSPMPKEGPSATWPPEGLDIEARATRGEAPLFMRKASLYLRTFIAWLIFATGIPVAGFDPKRYKEFTSLNTDYRKFQDGLRITVSLGNTELEKLTEFLEDERKAKIFATDFVFKIVQS